jgi:hypothetical protein
MNIGFVDFYQEFKNNNPEHRNNGFGMSGYGKRCTEIIVFNNKADLPAWMLLKRLAWHSSQAPPWFHPQLLPH